MLLCNGQKITTGISTSEAGIPSLGIQGNTDKTENTHKGKGWNT